MAHLHHIPLRILVPFVLWTSTATAQDGFRIDGEPATAFDVDLGGRVFFLRAGRNTLAVTGPAGKPVSEIGGGGWSENEFDQPAAVWAKDGLDVYVADYGNHRIQRFDRNLNFVSSFSTRAAENTPFRFGYPSDVAVSRQGDLYLCDTENSRILKVTGGTAVERTFGGLEGGKGRLLKPRRLAVGPQDRVYVTDGDRVAVFDSFGNYLHDLAALSPGDAALIDGDDDGVIVLSGLRLHLYDASDRLTGTRMLDTLAGKPIAPVRDIALSAGRVYLLAGQTVLALSDPRPASDALKK